MKIRWFTQKKQVTAEEVREFSNHSGHRFMKAKELLECKEGPTLQFFDENSHEWVDVPSEVYGYGGE